VEKVAVEEEVVRDLKGSEKKTVHSLFLLLWCYFAGVVYKQGGCRRRWWRRWLLKKRWCDMVMVMVWGEMNWCTLNISMNMLWCLLLPEGLRMRWLWMWCRPEFERRSRPLRPFYWPHLADISGSVCDAKEHDRRKWKCVRCRRTRQT